MENMEFKGTKGKWVAEKSEVVRHASSASISPYWKQICSFVPSGQEAKANAQLISKAPEMLEMLEKVLDVIAPEFPDDEQSNLIVSIKQLIKEATTI